MFLTPRQEGISVLLLGRVEVQGSDSDEQIDAEKAPDNDEHDEQDEGITVVVFDRSGGLICPIDYLEYVIRPAFQSAQHKKARHSRDDIVEVDIVLLPKPSATLFANIVRRIFVNFVAVS